MGSRLLHNPPKKHHRKHECELPHRIRDFNDEFIDFKVSREGESVLSDGAIAQCDECERVYVYYTGDYISEWHWVWNPIRKRSLLKKYDPNRRKAAVKKKYIRKRHTRA